MRVNIYSQELTNEVRLVEKQGNDGQTYSAVMLMLHSSHMLHQPPEHKGNDDDRSAVTLWLPKSNYRRLDLADTLERMAALVRAAKDETHLPLTSSTDRSPWLPIESAPTDDREFYVGKWFEPNELKPGSPATFLQTISHRENEADNSRGRGFDHQNGPFGGGAQVWAPLLPPYNQSYLRHKGVGIMSDIDTRVKKIVVEHLGVDANKVVDDAAFIDDLGADSLDVVELVMAFEEEFAVEIPDEQAEKLSTVKDAVEWISKNNPQ